jgi:hypothetical protein
MRCVVTSSRVTVIVTVILTTLATPVVVQEVQPSFGGSYSSLDARRRHFVDDWVARFTEATGRKMEPAEFYDGVVKLSSKTTFEAITHALMRTALTDASGNALGDALALVEHVDTIKGKVLGAAGDHQFRMYVRLRADALDVLARSQQFRRAADNTVYHKGYPINYRGQGGPPSIQVSAAMDRRHADIDVDYRSSSFPMGLFNGHLAASNSDVQAGNNYDRHTRRWTGFQNWWRNFFGIRLTSDADVPESEMSEARAPRIGQKPVEAMTEDFLEAWLVEGDIRNALNYISRRAFACLAEDRDDPASLDRGMAPFVLAHRLKVAHDAVGPQTSLEGLVVGVRLTNPGLRLVTQRHHAQFVVYAVPDDIAGAFDCESKRSLGGHKGGGRVYGNYFGATFYVKGTQSSTPLALLWAEDGGYWRIVSWQTDPEGENEIPDSAAPPVAAPARIGADASLVQAAHEFLESWLIRKDYNTAFSYVSPKAYACYDLVRSPDQPAATSLVDAGAEIRAGLEKAGSEIGTVRNLDDVVQAADPFHPAVRIMDHRYASAFSLSSIPNALAEAADCAARSRGKPLPASDPPPEYGTAFEMTTRVRTRAGDPPVLRTMWVKEGGAWRITVYAVEVP